MGTVAAGFRSPTAAGVVPSEVRVWRSICLSIGRPPLLSSGNPSAVVMTPEEGAEAAHQHELAHAMSGSFAQSDPNLIRQVIQATARFHSTTQASRAGYGPNGLFAPFNPSVTCP
jgi:hypothetical protein